ncbi:Drug/metabolite transporter [Corchorus olitorius]|uniref:WAT1-related protein n=1 Tax=Corchorus olitorius TaxID=93759 RepID=A0A1R3JB36_9ROSI|nr:Drug/metabolite transporter [Corchorus olitorius]
MEGDEQQQQQEKEGKLISYEGLKPYVICIFVNICSAGFNIISKVSLNNGMNSFVLAVYSGVIGTLTTALFALVFERVVLGRALFYVGLKDTSATAAAVLANLLPSMTFTLAVLFRMEPLDITKHSAQAKVGGTLVALAGATLTILYRGYVVLSPHFAHHSKSSSSSKLPLNNHWVKGSALVLISYLSASAFFVLQASTVKKYPAPITLTSLTCLSGTILSAIIAVAVDHEASSWRLSWDINLVAVLYNGIVVYGLVFYLQSLVAQTKDAVFMTAFRPLGTIITILMGLFILGDPLFLGRMVGNGIPLIYVKMNKLACPVRRNIAPSSGIVVL